MKITADDLHELNIADEVVKEPIGGAHQDVKAQALNIKAAFEKHLTELTELDEQALIEDRYQKFRNIGSFTE